MNQLTEKKKKNTIYLRQDVASMRERKVSTKDFRESKKMNSAVR